jgi:hypothetical protein
MSLYRLFNNTHPLVYVHSFHRGCMTLCEEPAYRTKQYTCSTVQLAMQAPETHTVTKHESAHNSQTSHIAGVALEAATSQAAATWQQSCAVFASCTIQLTTIMMEKPPANFSCEHCLCAVLCAVQRSKYDAHV